MEKIIISRKFFRDITKSTSCPHHLLPEPKMESHNSRLRAYEKFPRVYILVPNDTAHSYSMSWGTIRTGYKITTVVYPIRHTVLFSPSLDLLLVVSCTAGIVSLPHVVLCCNSFVFCFVRCLLADIQYCFDFVVLTGILLLCVCLAIQLSEPEMCYD